MASCVPAVERVLGIEAGDDLDFRVAVAAVELVVFRVVVARPALAQDHAEGAHDVRLARIVFTDEHQGCVARHPRAQRALNGAVVPDLERLEDWHSLSAM